MAIRRDRRRIQFVDVVTTSCVDWVILNDNLFELPVTLKLLTEVTQTSSNKLFLLLIIPSLLDLQS